MKAVHTSSLSVTLAFYVFIILVPDLIIADPVLFILLEHKGHRSCRISSVLHSNEDVSELMKVYARLQGSCNIHAFLALMLTCGKSLDEIADRERCYHHRGFVRFEQSRHAKMNPELAARSHELVLQCCDSISYSTARRLTRKQEAGPDVDGGKPFLVGASMASEEPFHEFIGLDGTLVDEDLHAMRANEPNSEHAWRASHRRAIRVSVYIFTPGAPWWICMHIHVYLGVLNRNFEHCTAR